MNYLANAALFLIKVAFSLYITLFLIRILLQLVKADYFNPLSRFIITATKWPVYPFRKLIPTIYSIDIKAIIFVILLQMLQNFLLLSLNGASAHLIGLTILSIAGIFSQLITLYFYLIIIQVIVSWVAMGNNNLYHHPIIYAINQLVAPLAKPFRRIIPPIGGIDISPLIIILSLQIANMILVAPLLNFGMKLAVGG